jgi:hypothetical protein
MTTGFPATIDTFNNPTAVDNLNTATKVHHDQHTNINDAVRAIMLELGTNTKGAATSVRARMEAIEAALAGKTDASTAGDPGGYATLDGGGMLNQNVAASKVSSGILNVLRIPDLSGAKILGTGSGGAAIPVDAVPNLDVAKITTGIFSTARIPNLDAAKITTGTIAAARLPSSVTANANSKVVNAVADLASIAMVDRVDGMLVEVKTPQVLYMYRADNDTFNKVHDTQYKSLAVIEETGVNNTTWNTTALNFAAKAGFTYAFLGCLFAQNPSTSTCGIRIGMSWTGTGTLWMGANGLLYPTSNPNINNDMSTICVMADAATPAQPGTGFGLPAGITTMIDLRGTFVCTADATVSIQINQNVTSAFKSRLEINSWLRAERMI